MKKIITTIIVLCLAFIVVGCSAPETTKETINKEQTIEEEKGPFGSTESAKQDLLNVLSKRDESEYLIEYEVETKTFQQTQTGGSVEQTMKATQIIAQKGSNMKVDSMQNVNGQPMRSMFFKLDTGAYICAEHDGDFRCFGSEGSMEESEEVSTDKIEENAMNYPVASAGTKKIAGYDTNCYRILAGEAAYDDTVMTGCYTNDGAALYIKTETTDGYTAVMEATKYQKSVSDSEFELPAEVLDMSEMFG